MNPEEIYKQSVKNHKDALALLEAQQATMISIADIFCDAIGKGAKLMFMGNGGSAADAQHLAAEFVGRFKKNRSPWAALALTTNTSTITAIGNDFGFENIFVRQIEALGKPGDVVIGISTSGDSQNVLLGVEKAKQLKMKTIGFLGKDGGSLKRMVDTALLISSSDTPRVQEMHILAGHILCEIVEQKITDR
jgi:D-sedoheptulose 7-phosphate isomerase